jgi:hypothetical protein
MTSIAQPYPRFAREVITPEPALLSFIGAARAAGSEKEPSTSPLIYALMVFAVFFLLGLVFSVYESQGWLLLGMMGGAGVVLGGLAYVKARAAHAQQSAQTADFSACTQVIRHTLDLSGPHRLVFHEHSLLVLAPLAPGYTFVHDINGAAGHPWYESVSAAYWAKTLKSRWVWYEIFGPSGQTDRLQGFSQEGPPLVPRVREDFADTDELIEFAELFCDEWLPADCIAKVDFDQLMAADNALRARYAQAKKPKPAQPSRQPAPALQ